MIKVDNVYKHFGGFRAVDGATLEIKEFESIPAAVIVSEAVELATKYSTESSSPFINGVLAGICSKLRPEEKIS